jgi:hypothetical protein
MTDLLHPASMIPATWPCVGCGQPVATMRICGDAAALLVTFDVHDEAFLPLPHFGGQRAHDFVTPIMTRHICPDVADLIERELTAAAEMARPQ